MLSDFLQYLVKQDLCRKNERILIAVSGGIDSMVLLDLFYRGGFDLGIAHCNFQLRGDASLGDQAFTEGRAIDMDVPFFTVRFDTGEYAAGWAGYEWRRMLPVGRSGQADAVRDSPRRRSRHCGSAARCRYRSQNQSRSSPLTS